jgi:hypothetical protein
MTTKDPGYYRNLLESIEIEATHTVTEDKAQLIATAQAIRDDLARALNSKDTNEILRLVQGAHNSMEDVMLAIRRGGVAEEHAAMDEEHAAMDEGRGDSVSAGIGTTLVRNRGTDDEEEIDVWVEFTATMVSPGFAGDRYDPPHGPEWEFEIDDISVDLPRGMTPGPEDQLTQAEKHEIEAWFDKNLDRAEEAANDKISDSY